MTAKKTNAKGKPRNQTKGKIKKKSWLSRFSRYFLVPVIFLAVIAWLLIWQWPAITEWVTSLITGTWHLFGWGLVLMAAGIVSILVALYWKPASLIRRWNRWLGSIAFGLAIWGILGLFYTGGSIGQRFGSPDLVGLFKILGLALLGFIFMAPGISFRLASRFFTWLNKQMKAQPRPKPVTPSRQKTQVPPVATPVRETARQTEIKREPEKPKAMTTITQAQQELKEVAQEVWKKYGESPALLTVDGWRLPPIDILERSPEIEFSHADNLQRAQLIEDALASYGVDTKVVQINAGPTVTQFGVEPGWDRKIKEIKERDKDGGIHIREEEISKTRVKVERITGLANDLALSLAAPSIRIEAPVPGKSVVGIEVPNTISTSVSLREVVESSVFQKTQTKTRLPLALGKGAGGEAVVGDLTKMPHLLIAGATGSGKTVCLNAMICCLLLQNTPYDLKVIMIDPKRVELTQYNGIPQLATPVIVDTTKALNILRWLNSEMDKRYQKMATEGARNIESYNKNKSTTDRFPYVVLVIDELADLMMAGFDEVEQILCRLAQLARATGIHLIVATQRPSVDVVTGLIKANFPTRISFAVTSQIDSRTILDSGGAEKLLGKGDMLYMPTEASKPKRLQGCYVSDPEIERLVYFWGNQRKEEVTSLNIDDVTAAAATKKESIPEDPLLDAARQLAQEHKNISTSYLQRRLRIGYPRAARIMEQLKEEGETDEEEKGE